MRLTKVQKALKEARIPYEYEETVHMGEVFGEIRFSCDGKMYMVEEISGTRGKKPSGIYTNIRGWRDRANQVKIAEAITNKNF